MDIKLSIICATYNHEKYLNDALDGILLQQVDFPFEVLIGEDASTDNSRRILSEYQDKYPGLFNVFYRKQNYGPIDNFNDLYKRAKGKYIVVLETDDFWIDPLKLEREVSFLDLHSDVFEVAHNCVMVDQNDNPLNVMYPERRKNRYSFSDYRKGIMPGQTTSVMYRNFYYRDIGDDSFWLLTNPKYEIGPGDRRRAFIAADKKTICLPYIMSAYRFVTSGGDSFTANNRQNYEDIEKFYTNILTFANEHMRNPEAIYSAEFTYFFALTYYYFKREHGIDYNRIKNEFSKLTFKKRIFVSTILKYIGIVLKKPFGLNKEYKKVVGHSLYNVYSDHMKNRENYLNSSKSIAHSYKKYAIV